MRTLFFSLSSLILFHGVCYGTQKPWSYGSMDTPVTSSQKKTKEVSRVSSSHSKMRTAPSKSAGAMTNTSPKSSNALPSSVRKVSPQTSKSSKSSKSSGSLSSSTSSEKKSLHWKGKDSFAQERLGTEKTLQEVLEKDTTGMAKRRYKASQGRSKQVTGETIQQTTTEIGDALEAPVALVKKATNSPIAGILVSTIKYGGGTIGTVLTALGRYEERTQKIFSANEQLVDGAQKSFEKIEVLTEEIQELVEYRTLSETTQSRQKNKDVSVKKRIKRSLSPSTWKNTVEHLLDKTYFTDFKSQRAEDIKALQIQLKQEKDHFEEIIRLLQIKLLQDSLKDIEKRLNKEQTLKVLHSNFATLHEAQRQIMDDINTAQRNKKTKTKESLMKVLAQHESKMEQDKEELNFYGALTLTPEERLKLENDQEKLKNEIKRLYDLTQLSKSRTSALEEEDGKAPLTLGEKKKILDSLKTMEERIKTLEQESARLKQNPLPIYRFKNNTPIPTPQ